MRYIVFLMFAFVFNNTFAMQKRVPVDFRTHIINKDADFVQCLARIGQFIASLELYREKVYPDMSQYSVGYGDGFLAKSILSKGQNALPKGVKGMIIATDSMLDNIERIIFIEIPYLEKKSNVQFYKNCHELIAITSRLYQQGLPQFQQKKITQMFAKHYNTCSIAQMWLKEMPHKHRAECELKYFTNGIKCKLQTYGAKCKMV